MADHRIDLAAIEANLNGHSIFAPSSSPRWLHCPGSLIPNVLTPDEGSYEAAEGTVAHAVGERWLREGVEPKELIGRVERVVEGDKYYDILITAEMLDYVQEYVDWVEMLPGEHYIETKVDFSDLTPIPNQRGTADHAACSSGSLIITDLKYGVGVQVFAENNDQLRLYAYGFFREYDWMYDFQTIALRICQPRLRHFDEWVITRDELLEFAESVKLKATLAWTPDAPRVPGEKACTFCAVKATCAALANATRLATEGVFDDLTLPLLGDEAETLRKRIQDGYSPAPISPYDLSTAEMAKVLLWRKGVEGWFKAVAEELYRRLDLGETVDEWKLVDGKSKRDWKDKNAAAEHLQFLGLDEDEIYERSMVSPSKAEKALVEFGYKRKQLPGLIDPAVVKTKGAMTMTRASDARESVTTGDPFDNIDGEL